MRVIKAPPKDLATLLFELGPRTLVLVEGEDDLKALDEWYRERLADIMFYVPGGGCLGVQQHLSKVLVISTHKRAYGIIDRDFRDDSEVEACLTDPDAHLFILRRYALENYLLEPEAINEELRVLYDYGKTLVVPDASEIENDLLDLCRRILPVMAANWVLLGAGVENFSEGFPINERSVIVSQAAKRLGCDAAAAQRLIAAKEALLAPLLGTLATAHTGINGKHLLHHLHERYVAIAKRGISKDYLCSLLIRTIKEKPGLPADIREIIEDRILQTSVGP